MRGRGGGARGSRRAARGCAFGRGGAYGLLQVAASLAAAACLSTAARAEEDAEDHIFAHEDRVPVVANKVGPFANPHETYPYYSLPFCPPSNLKPEDHELGELLSGDRKVNTPYDVRFPFDYEWLPLCSVNLNKDDVAKFQTAIMEDYYFEMFVDDLPIWGYIGNHDGDDLLGTAPTKLYLYKHMQFDISYDAKHGHVIAVNVTMDPSRTEDISADKAVDVQFSYGVKWTKTNVKFEDRLERYHQQHFLPESLEIHWLSIVNSLVLVLLLTAFLGIILLRTVKNDCTRYMLAAEDEEAADEDTESGWKLIHGDVFRKPGSTNAFCALVGTGAQLFTMVFSLLTMAMLGLFAPTRRGAIVTACIVLYALSAGVGGYVSARLYRQLEPKGTSWVFNIVMTSLTFPGPMLATFSYLNSVAISYDSTAALPFGTILVILLLYLLVTFPLTVLGGIAGRNTAGDFEAPCRTKKAPRQVPPLACYRGGFVQVLTAGFLPFSAISIELHYIFASVWGHKQYTLFGILYLAFALLTIVTSFIVISVTYFQLSAEDHRWWWRSFLSGGSVGFFIYAYCFFYYFNHSEMSGILQTSFYFGYMANVAFAFFLMMGFIGFYSSLWFVRKLYSSVKID